MTTSKKFGEEIWLNKKKVMPIMYIGMVLFGLSVIGIILSYMFWDDYTYQVKTLKGIKTRGWPSTVSGWSWGFGICIAIIYPLMYFFMFDFKRPVLAINDEGILINKSMFKNAFVKWDEIQSVNVKENNGEWTLQLSFVDPIKIVEKQPGLSKAFLGEYKKGTPLSLDAQFCDGDFKEFCQRSKIYFENTGIVVEEGQLT
ncbi:MAG: hypothetical protein MRY83_15200 [Flavobacteriales bacterium]|nr:hypothetical protein [Flavobacteriales bacterium]